MSDPAGPPQADPFAWVLAIVRCQDGLQWFVSDGAHRFAHGRMAEVAADRADPALAADLPDDLSRALAQSGGGPLRLQLDPALDLLPWEAAVARHAPQCIVVRWLRGGGRADVPAPPAHAARAGAWGNVSTTAPLWLHNDPEHWTAAAAGALAAGGAAVAVHGTTPHGLALAFREDALRLWQAGHWLSEATAQAATRLGLPRGRWRQYGDLRRSLAAPPATAEWRAVTTVSVDMIQSTGLLHEWGAERYAQRHADFHALWRRIAQQHQGRLDNPQGNDGVMAYFGLAGAHEGAAAQAVQAAWALVQEAPRLGFGLRVGISSGRVAVSDGQPFGVAIHLAARLQAIAPTNGIALSDATHELLGPGVVCEPMADTPQLRGFDGPQRVWLVREVRTSAPTVAWQRRGRGRFVGREPHMQALLSAWGQCVAGVRARTVLLLGEPGVGKSRLLREFESVLMQRDAPASHWLRVTGQATLQSSPFAALAQVAGNPLLAPLAAPPRAAQERPGEPDRPPDAAPSAAATGALDQPALIEALASHAAALCRDTPVCIVADDVQWLDPSTLEWLQRLRVACTELPLLLVLSVREQARESVAAFAADDTVALAPLDTEQALALIESLTGQHRLAPPLRQAIADRGGGIPLFIEETARLVAAGADGSDELPTDIPATLDDVLTARLDGLGGAKPLAQLAAVLGNEFPQALWDAVLACADDWIVRARCAGDFHRLLDSGLLKLEAGPTPRVCFRHALVRDAAYESLWLRDRQRLHGVVAQALQSLDLSAGLELRGHHLQAAGQHEAALAAWMAAARAAAARGAEREALALTRRALLASQHLPDTPQLRRQTLQLHLMQAARCIALEGYSAASVESAYLRAAALCDGLADTDAETRLRVDLGLEACYAMRGDLERARTLAESAVRRSPWESNLRLALQARWAWTNVVFHQGDTRAALEMADACLARYQPSLHPRAAVQDPAVMFLCYSAWGMFQHGRADEARRRAARAVELALHLDHAFSIGVAHGFAASVALFCGDAETGLAHAEEALARCSDRAFGAWQAHARIVRGRLRAASGQFDLGLQDMQEGVDQWLGTGARITVATYLAFQAEAWLLQDEPERALHLLQQAREIAQRHGERYHMAELLRLLGCARWMAGSGDAAAQAEAQTLLREALALAQAQGNDGFVLRAAMGLGQTLAEQGDASGAADLVRWALHAVPGQAQTSDARAARALLASLGCEAPESAGGASAPSMRIV